MKKTIIKDDFLFHSVHGLCRVEAVKVSTQSTEGSYSLLPVSTNKSKMRFIVPEGALENAGFSKLISVKEANAILDYFKTGNKKDSECGQAWTLATEVRSESSGTGSVKDTRTRQRLDRSVKGLAGELGFVLNFSSREIADRIQRNLGSPAKINPLVLSALANVERD